jgi:hypothetical protein
MKKCLPFLIFILAKKSRHMNHIIQGEAIETKLHYNTVSRKDGFSLSNSWKPVSHAMYRGRHF